MSTTPPDSRAQQALGAARELLEEEGWEAVSMRRIAERLGIRASSLYKHLRDKHDLELALVSEGMTELAGAILGAGPELRPMADAYRAYALAHPHLYRLMTDRPLDRSRLPPNLEADAAQPLLAVTGSEDRARAAWAAAHGLASLEIAQRFPPDADIDAAWAAMVAAFGPAA